MTTTLSNRSHPRPIRIQRAVLEAMQRSTRRQSDARLAALPERAILVDSTLDQSNIPPAETILRSLPRREQAINPNTQAFRLPYIPSLSSKSNFWRSLRRLFTWLGVITYLVFSSLGDRLLRRNTIERRAVRLRKTLERASGTFVKFGQQAAMRIDLLPWAYCIELSKMLDTMEPFPFEQALQAIERAIHRPWQGVFSVIDPTPVGSASVACVYQATLMDGSKVVIKVRRPGIRDLFLADLQVLDWLARLAEFLTILRPGFTRNPRSELRDTLLEELDFIREGHFQDTFRRNAKKSGQTFFNAPEVYFEYSSEEVLVQEFISGLKLTEVISAVEGNSAKGKRWLSRLNIDPKVVARNILWATFWSSDEHIFFHADPHPANIIVRPDNEIVFIDFGSCGSFNNQQKVALEQIVLSMKNKDVEAMIRATLTMMDPLPPVDIPSLVKQGEEEFMRILFTFNTPAQYTQYWERTSARLWLSVIRVARNFNISLNLHMLRMIRATLLYDSIVLRLDKRVDRYDEYTLFMKDRAEMVKQRWRTKLRDNSGDQFFLNLDDTSKALNDLMIRAQTIVNRPIFNLGATVGKSVFAASVLTRMFARIFLITLLAMGAVYLFNPANRAGMPYQEIFQSVIHNNFYLLTIFGIVIISIRHITIRLKDRD